MGHYTTIAKLARTAARSSPKRRFARSESTEGTGPDLYLCPVCADTSVAPATCGRCGVSMSRDGEGHLESSKSARAPSRLRGWINAAIGAAIVVPGAAAVGGVLMLAVDPININMRSSHFTSPMNGLVFFGAAAVAALFGAFGLFVGPRIARWLDRRLRLGAPLATRRASLVPEEGTERLRIRGEVRVEPAEDGTLHAYVSSDGVRLRLPPAAEVRVLDEDGERGILANGDEVEVVGVARRTRARAEGAYRTSEAELVFESARVWVEQ